MIVETARGVEFGTVVTGQRDVEDDKITQPLKPSSVLLPRMTSARKKRTGKRKRKHLASA